MNIRKKISGAFLALAVGCMLCSCQQTEAKTESAADLELPELKIGVDILKPFFYIDENGHYAGIDAEIAEEACRRAGYAPDFVEVSWSERDSELQSGNIDCIWSAFIKNGREDLYDWTDTYLQSNLRVIVDAKSPDHDMRSLNGPGGMAVRADSKIEEILLKNESDRKPIRIYTCGSFEMAENAFVKGYVGALGGHEAVLQDVIQNYSEEYRFLDGSILAADLGVAFCRKDDSEARDKINDALEAMKAEGVIENVYESYTLGQLVKEGVTDSE